MISGTSANLSSFSPGQVLAGKYRIERVLGAGGMGVVLAAHHLHLDEPVAIKLMLPETLGNAEAVARFLREARAAVKIKSEHVARVSDVGTLESGEPYIVMEYLEGEDLAAWLTTRGALSVEQASEFLIQACEALAEAHSLGIVHRDLKPANLFCTRRADGLLAIKVLDFGISKAATGSLSDLEVTKTAAVMGSPLYMSPEQLESARNVDARGDIWALGAILYELVSGRPPFLADSLSGVILQIATRPPIPLSSVRADLPPALEAVILRCLQKQREARFPNVAELARALVDFAPQRARSSVDRALRVVQAAGPSSWDLQSTSSESTLSEAAWSVQGALSPRLPMTPAASGGSGTHASFGNTLAPRRSSGRKLRLGLLGVVLTTAVLGAALLLHRSLSVNAGPGLSASAQPVSAPSVVPAVIVSAPAATSGSESDSAEASPAPEASPVAVVGEGPAMPRPAAPKTALKGPNPARPGPKPSALAKPSPRPDKAPPIAGTSARDSVNSLIEDRQ